MIKKCLSCGATVEVIKNCECPNCGVQCCGKPMVEVKENSVECAVEKHLPVYRVENDKVLVTVPHVMEDEHHIDYIAIESENFYARQNLEVGKPAEATFPYIKGAKLVSSCNKHGLWSVVIK